MSGSFRFAPYVLRALLGDDRRQEGGAERRLGHLEALASEVGGERASVRAAVSLLHRLQLVDALRMTLTPTGRMVAALVDAGRLPPVAWTQELLLS